MIEGLLGIGKTDGVVVCNDSGVCFLGETDNLITYANISTHFNVTQGYRNTASEANQWLHFTLDGREMYVSKVAIRYNISWDHLYSKGLVYGTNNNGVRPTGTPTNQYKTISLNGKTYKARLLKGADPGMDLYSGDSQRDTVGTRNSEWSRLFYPIVSDDNTIVSYTGDKIANYTRVQLGVDNRSGRASWCQETISGALNQRLLRGFNYSTDIRFLETTLGSVNGNHGWRACLELV